MSNLLQQAVADRLALGVVDARKIIDIEHQNGDAALARRGPFHLLLQDLQQPLPVRQRGERIVVGEIADSRFALAQLILSLLGAHQELDALRQQHGIDSFGREVGGARIVGALYGLHVVETGLHQDWNMARTRQRPQCLADLEAVHARHDHVENHAVGGMQMKLAHRTLAVRCRGDVKARDLQRTAHEQSRAGIVVDHQHGGGEIILIVGLIHWIL
jgi:hypothetical protein